jgi:deoxycytidine triphosphate deaminase
MLTLIAPLVIQFKAEEEEDAMTAGEAVNEEMAGARPLGVMLFEAEEDVEVPAALVAVTLKV